jgi:hypothetical protein
MKKQDYINHLHDKRDKLQNSIKRIPVSISHTTDTYKKNLLEKILAKKTAELENVKEQLVKLEMPQKEIQPQTETMMPSNSVSKVDQITDFYNLVLGDSDDWQRDKKINKFIEEKISNIYNKLETSELKKKLRKIFEDYIDEKSDLQKIIKELNDIIKILQTDASNKSEIDFIQLILEIVTSNNTKKISNLFMLIDYKIEGILMNESMYGGNQNYKEKYLKYKKKYLELKNNKY